MRCINFLIKILPKHFSVLEVDPWKLKLIRAILFSFQGAIKSHYGLLHSLLKSDPESQPANYTSSLLKLIVKPYCWLLLYAAALASTKGGYISNVSPSREGYNPFSTWNLQYKYAIIKWVGRSALDSVNISNEYCRWVGNSTLNQGPLKKWTEHSQEMHLLKIHSSGGFYYTSALDGGWFLDRELL